jgi:hypothetical protein
MWRFSLVTLILFAAACGRDDGSDRRHALARPDTTVAADSAEDRPCIASHVGLPCH